MPNKQTSIHNFNIGLQNNFFMHGKAELINQTCHTKTFFAEYGNSQKENSFEL